MIKNTLRQAQGTEKVMLVKEILLTEPAEVCILKSEWILFHLYTETNPLFTIINYNVTI